eukprot:SAG31_NODE_409_length_16006_cov_10.345760_2_plen_157_part_00
MGRAAAVGGARLRRRSRRSCEGCCFVVFVQLFEKYGTLIERNTALIEKVSPCRALMKKKAAAPLPPAMAAGPQQAPTAIGLETSKEDLLRRILELEEERDYLLGNYSMMSSMDALSPRNPRLGSPMAVAGDEIFVINWNVAGVNTNAFEFHLNAER